MNSRRGRSGHGGFLPSPPACTLLWADAQGLGSRPATGTQSHLQTRPTPTGFLPLHPDMVISTKNCLNPYLPTPTPAWSGHKLPGTAGHWLVKR